jgi:hypothetical protein
MLKWFFGTIGISPILKSEHKDVREIGISEDLIEKAKRLSAALGIDPRKLLGKQQPTEEEW